MREALVRRARENRSYWLTSSKRKLVDNVTLTNALQEKSSIEKIQYIRVEKSLSIIAPISA